MDVLIDAYCLVIYKSICRACECNSDFFPNGVCSNMVPLFIMINAPLYS